MSAHPKLIAMLILSGLLLVGCGTPAAVGGSTNNACDYDYSRLMESKWKFYGQTALSAGKDGELDASQCVVMYQVESQQVEPSPGLMFTRNIAPVFGTIYRKDRNRSRDIYQYELNLPGDMYLGERTVTARVDDNVLSGATKPQLIIEDKDAAGLVVEASLWEWEEQPQAANSVYHSRGWFFGDAGVTVEPDKVTVLNRWRNSPRSEMAQRMVYVPRNKKNYYRPEDTSRIVDPVTVDLVPLVMPDDANLPTAEYPEKLALAFYQRIPLLITDTAKLMPIMSSAMIDSYGKRDPQVFGCLADSALTRVYVQDLDTSGSPGIPSHIENKDATVTDTIKIKSLCMLNVSGKETPKDNFVTWSVQWDWKVATRTGKWQIIGATAK